MNQFNNIRRLQQCGIIVPYSQSHRVAAAFCMNSSEGMKQKRLGLLKK